MDEIETRENLTLIREKLSSMPNGSVADVLELIVSVIEFIQEEVTELQDAQEE